MKVEVLYFAHLKEVVKKDREQLDLSEGVTLRDLLQQLQRQYEHETFQSKSLKAAINEEFAAFDQKLADGDTVALLPPVSGG